MNKIASLLVLLFLASAPFQAGHAAASLEVSPIRIVLTKGSTVAAMTIHNRSTEDAVVQLRVAKWSQTDGQEVHEDSEDLIACPPLFDIVAGEEQVVRIALGDGISDWTTETSYRLFIQEVPEPQDENANNQIQFAVRISIPVFLQSEDTSQPPLMWSLEQNDTGLWATVQNGGNAHVLIAGIRLMKDNGIFFEANTHQYVLPGSTMTWRLDTATPFVGDLPDSFELAASTDQGVYQETMPAGR